MVAILKNIQLSNDIFYLGTVEPEQAIPPIVEVNTNEPAPQHEDIFREGYEQGNLDANKALQDKNTLLNTLLCTLPEQIEQSRFALKDEITDIVMSIIEPFFIQQQDSTAIGTQIEQLLSQVNQKKGLKIHLHPKDIALIQQGKISLDLKQYQQLSFVADESLRLGGVLIKNGHGFFDASVEKRIDNLKQILMTIKNEQYHV